ncbi:MAG TPA: hypothetical protein DIW64_10125 [Cellvibrio sp.]|nr:hypothetical protein [Cellvibrio sp.]
MALDYLSNVKAITEWRCRLKIEARRIQEKPRSGELGGTITAGRSYVNNPLRLSLFLSVMTRKFIGLALVSWRY